MGLIYLDTCLIVYLVEERSPWSKRVAEAMALARTEHFGISPLSKCECLVAPLKRGDPILENSYKAFFGLCIDLAMPESVYLQAARLRARFGLKTPDALHLACAQHHECDALWTNDRRLAHASHGMAQNVLR